MKIQDWDYLHWHWKLRTFDKKWQKQILSIPPSGHDTNECLQLKDEIEGLIRCKYLGQYVGNYRSSSRDRQTPKRRNFVELGASMLSSQTQEAHPLAMVVCKINKNHNSELLYFLLQIINIIWVLISPQGVKASLGHINMWKLMTSKDHSIQKSPNST